MKTIAFCKCIVEKKYDHTINNFINNFQVILDRLDRLIIHFRKIYLSQKRKGIIFKSLRRNCSDITQVNKKM